MSEISLRAKFKWQIEIDTTWVVWIEDLPKKAQSFTCNVAAFEYAAKLKMDHADSVIFVETKYIEKIRFGKHKPGLDTM